MRHTILFLLTLLGIALLGNLFSGQPGNQAAKIQLHLQPAEGVVGEQILLTVSLRNGTQRSLRLAPHRATRDEVWQITVDGPDGSFAPLATPGPFVPFKPDEIVEVSPGAFYEFTTDLSGFVRSQEGRLQKLRAGRYRVNVLYQAPGGEERANLGLWPEELPLATLDVSFAENSQSHEGSSVRQLWCSLGITTGRPNSTFHIGPDGVVRGRRLGDGGELRLKPEEIDEIFQRFQAAGAQDLGPPTSRVGTSEHLSFSLILEDGDKRLTLEGGDRSDPRARAVFELCEELLERLRKEGESSP
jgi:hypothetical protein